MRFCISLHSAKGQRLPLSHLDLLRQTLQERTDLNLAALSFSDLRVPTQIRGIDSEREELCIGAGNIQWWLSSPHTQVIRRLAGAFNTGSAVEIGAARFTVKDTFLAPLPERLATPAPTTAARFSCWTPIVAQIFEPEISHKPFFASPVPDDHLFAERIRESLVEKYAMLYGVPPQNDYLGIGFDQEYLERHPRRGTKRILSDGRPVTGVLAPFVLRGSSELLRTAWQCGIGDLTTHGFGFVEVVR